MTFTITRYIVRNGVRVDITNCFFCSGNETAVCGACCAKADAAEDRAAQDELARLEAARDDR